MNYPAARPTLAQLAARARGSDDWQCPRCGCRDWRVRSTWHTAAGIRRSRVCRHCGQGVITTTETPEAPPAAPTAANANLPRANLPRAGEPPIVTPGE